MESSVEVVAAVPWSRLLLSEASSLGKNLCTSPLKVGTQEQMIAVLVSTVLQMVGRGECHVKSGLTVKG